MIERISAASIILKKFADLDCFICLATHDVELSRILGERYENYHFREVVTEDDILFDYTLQEGVTTGSNAIKLLAYCHYDQEIVDQAEKYAENYVIQTRIFVLERKLFRQNRTSQLNQRLVQKYG